MLFRTNDSGRWGDGTGIDLEPSEIDRNFWELLESINNLIANPIAPVSIVSISSSANRLTFHMSDGSTIGPVFMPVLQYHWRGDWLPETVFETHDTFKKTGVGLYMVLIDHVSLTTFDPGLTIDGEPAYLEMFAFAPAANVIYDVGFTYAGLLSDISSDVTYLYQEPFVRKVLLPVTPALGAVHQAYLQEAPTTAAQDFIIYQNDVSIGTVHFDIGDNEGTITITVDVTFDIGSRLAVGPPAVDDATASVLSIVFAAQQVVE